MSSKMIALVFERFHGQGGSMLLALALADHAHDDGTHVFPSVAHLAFKSRQSERAVQYQLRAMESEGFIIKVRAGGRGRTTEYRIAPDFINARGRWAPPPAPPELPEDDEVSTGKGATAIAPQSPEKGAMVAPQTGPQTALGCKTTPFRVQQLLHPNLNTLNTNTTPLPPDGGMHPASANEPVQASGRSRGRDRSVGRHDGLPLLTLADWLAQLAARGEKPIRHDSAIWDYTQAIGLDDGHVRLQWLEFKDRYSASGKRRTDWLARFLESIKGNWYKFWWIDPQGEVRYTTQGLQARRARGFDQ